MIEKGTRFIGFSPKVDLSERKTANSNSETEPYTVDDIRGYKVFTALLTQSGGDNFQSQSSGSVQKGVTYFVDGGTIGLTDFSNVGGQFQTDITGSYYFIATVDGVPNEYGGATADYNTGAPIATVLENTIGNIWFTYNNDGYYAANSDNLFTIGKSSIIVGNTTWDGGVGLISSGFDGDSFAAIVTTLTDGTPGQTGGLLNTLIEIRVYN